MNFEIISDSACDIKKSDIQKYNINIVPFYFSFDGETYYKEGAEYTSFDFFNKLATEDLYPKTSLPSVQDYYDAFETILKDGKDVVCLCISSKFSGSFQSANNAKMNIQDAYPERRIEVIDSLAATYAQGAILKHIAKLRQNNATIDEVVASINNPKNDYKIYFTIDTLDYLQKGGRLGKGASLVGTFLDIKPILTLENGELFPLAKVRKKKKALDYIVDAAFDYSKSFDNFSVSILTCLDTDEAIEQLTALTKAKFGDDIELSFEYVGSTIGVHTGPNVCGILVTNY